MVNVIKVTNDLNDKWAFLNNYITDEEDYDRCVRTDAANVAKDMAKGMAKDMAKDMAKEQAIKMLNDKVDVNAISRYTNLSIKEILDINKNL